MSRKNWRPQPDRYRHTAHLEELSITEKEYAFKIIGDDKALGFVPVRMPFLKRKESFSPFIPSV